MAKLMLVGNKKIYYKDPKDIEQLKKWLKEKGWKFYLFDYDKRMYMKYDKGKAIFTRSFKSGKK